ncbi:MAG: cytochrome c biogenesis protein CcsA [Sedimentisphaerales bacterium]|jgi:ABC-type transport system involved in cytochrome c biogenesis permease subunit
MAVKYTIQGLLIYVTLAAYLLSLASMLLRRPKAAHIFFAFAFLFGCFAVAYRWLDVRHLPLQNLFEVFLFLSVIVYPVSVFCRRVLRVGGIAADVLIGAIVLFPAGFVFSADPQQLPPALQCWLFGPHVFVYMLSYVLMTKAAVHATLQLADMGTPPDSTEPQHLMVCAGFPLLTLGLVLGSVWGGLAWGDWWGWDPKELWSLASWLVYVAYFHFRYMFGRKFPRANNIWIIAGFVVIVITLLWVNLSNLFSGLHTYAI